MCLCVCGGGGGMGREDMWKLKNGYPIQVNGNIQTITTRMFLVLRTKVVQAQF